MQQTGLALLALAACAAFRPSEGEWGVRLSQPTMEGGALPSKMELEGKRYCQQLGAGISSYLHENGIHFNPSSPRGNFRKEPHLNRNISNLPPV